MSFTGNLACVTEQTHDIRVYIHKSYLVDLFCDAGYRKPGLKKIFTPNLQHCLARDPSEAKIIVEKGEMAYSICLKKCFYVRTLKFFAHLISDHLDYIDCAALCVIAKHTATS